MNVAHIIRTLAHQIQYDTKLHILVVKQLGFKQDERVFFNARFDNSNQNDDIGTVYLKDFIIGFGLVYEIFQNNDMQYFRSNLSENMNMCKNESDQLLTQANHHQKGLISSYCSQAHQEARQKEVSPIIKVFEEQELRLSCVNSQEMPDEQQPMKECEDLYANEDIIIQSQANQNIDFISNFSIIQQQKLNFNSDLQSMLHKLSNQENGKPQQEIQATKVNENNQDSKVFQETSNNNFLNFRHTLLSCNNSLLTTPIKPFRDSDNHLYPNHSELKTKLPSQRNLFATNHQDIVSPKTPMIGFSSTAYNTNKQMFPSTFKSQFQTKNFLGLKRGSSEIEQLEADAKQENQSLWITPFTHKSKSYPVHQDIEELREELSHESKQNSDSEEEKGGSPDFNDNVSTASRKKRGLKILSVKVQELVYQKQSTTYKDVANELIKQLRESRKKIQGQVGIEDFSDVEDDYMSDESPNKKSDGKMSVNSQQKWEKNVRRRVYDALNVLYAAGVLKKEGKFVSCDNRVFQMTKRLKESSKQTSGTNFSKRSVSSSCTKDKKSAQSLQNLKAQIQDQKSRLEQKREMLSEQFKHYLSYRNLVGRNSQLQSQGFYDEKQNIALPFILVTSKDTPDNEIEIAYGKENRSLNVSMKNELRCVGETDTLMRLGMYKANQEQISQHEPIFYEIMNLLNEKQRQEILMQ